MARRSLRSQILYPTLGVMLVATGCASITTAWLAAQRARRQIETQLQNVAETLSESTFPLTNAVLRQTRGLSGAEFAVVDERGSVFASTIPWEPPPDMASLQRPSRLALERIVALGEKRFFHVVVRRTPRLGERGVQTLHIFYPEHEWRVAWRAAVAPPLMVGLLSLGVMAALVSWLAERLTRPIVRLRAQVEEIAKGDFHPLPPPNRDDEIRDLATSVNRMAEMLARYEEEVRRHERLRTLGQLGGGIAHQMRNAATGCRMAIDLYRRQFPSAAENENLAIATRQLELMETYLRRFLTLGTEHAAPTASLDVATVVEHVLLLVRPTAVHLGVELRWYPPDSPMMVRGDENGLAQLIVNLTLNAIEAARSAVQTNEPIVELRLAQRGGMAVLEVADTGPGPSSDIQDRLFDPLVTDKPDGAGLGLPVAQTIAKLHGGGIHWERRAGWTCFVVELPLLKEEGSRVATVGS